MRERDLWVWTGLEAFMTFLCGLDLKKQIKKGVKPKGLVGSWKQNFSLDELLVKFGLSFALVFNFFRVRWLKPEEEDRLSSSLTLRHWNRNSPQSPGTAQTHYSRHITITVSSVLHNSCHTEPQCHVQYRVRPAESAVLICHIQAAKMKTAETICQKMR